MNRKQKRLVRLIAIILAVLLTISVVISAVISIAYAEESVLPAGNSCELTMEYMENEQALRISQRLVYTNVSDGDLDRVVFYAPANLFRRQDSLPYEPADLASVLPKGYFPGGMDIISIHADGETCDWGFQGQDEMYLRAACSLKSGESCTFTFDYYLLLTENAAFMGISENEWRLSDFYFSPASLDENGEFILNTPVSHAGYADVPAMDFSARIELPENMQLAAAGIEEASAGEDAASWNIHAGKLRDFSVVWGKNYHASISETESGINIRCLSTKKSRGAAAAKAAQEAIEICESWFGPFPFAQIDIIQTDYALDVLNHSACLWLSEDVLKDDRAMEHAVRRFIAQQYFGRSAWVQPSADAWLSDSVSEFIAYLILEEIEGHDFYLQALNNELVDSLQLTIPGGLRVNSDASLFTAYEYDIIVRCRGAIVFHELYTAMGRESLIAGLKSFYQKGLQTDVLTEMDLVHALDTASGKSWEKFLTDWVYNVGDYVNQDIYWLE